MGNRMLAKLISQIPVLGLLAMAAFEYWNAFKSDLPNPMSLGWCILFIILAAMAEIVVWID